MTFLHGLIDIFKSPLLIDAVGDSGPHIDHTFVDVIVPSIISILINAAQSLV
nr:MAG TPA: hypothetical protein [Caudoviricetes sp.]